MKKNNWSKKEILKLFSNIEKAKEENNSLISVFKSVAKTLKRKPNSIRNFYYQQVKKFKEDSSLANNLKINMENHKVLKSKKFSYQETKSIVKEILRKKCLGYSIRKACMQIANNNKAEMLRIQNKYRNILKCQKKLYDECLEELKAEGLDERRDKVMKKMQIESNVVFLKKNEEKKLSDEDISSLFMGLVKLVKKTAYENAEKQFFIENRNEKESTRNIVYRLSEAEKNVQILQNQIEQEKQKNRFLINENIQLKTKLAGYMSEKLLKSNKNKSLTNYLREIKQKGKEIRTKI